MESPTVRKKILVVDDSVLALHLMRSVLEKLGYQVVTQATPFGTAGVVLSEKPDLVLLDVNMPALNGDELTRIIRQHSLTQGTRVLLFSDMPEAELAKRAENAGADGYLHKTIDPEKLVSQLEKYLLKPSSCPMPTVKGGT